MPFLSNVAFPTSSGHGMRPHPGVLAVPLAYSVDSDPSKGLSSHQAPSVTCPVLYPPFLPDAALRLRGRGLSHVRKVPVLARLQHLHLSSWWLTRLSVHLLAGGVWPGYWTRQGRSRIARRVSGTAVRRLGERSGRTVFRLGLRTVVRLDPFMKRPTASPVVEFCLFLARARSALLSIVTTTSSPWQHGADCVAGPSQSFL